MCQAPCNWVCKGVVPVGKRQIHTHLHVGNHTHVHVGNYTHLHVVTCTHLHVDSRTHVRLDHTTGAQEPLQGS